MAKTTGTQFEGKTRVKVEYEQRRFLGLIRYWVKRKLESIGSDIYITTDEPIDNIFLNGKKIN